MTFPPSSQRRFSRLSSRTRPVGQPTRGKTALNRLRQVDVYVALAWASALTGWETRVESPLVVDVGYGAQAWTALEMRDRWLPLHPRLRLLGVEIDPERVAAAQPFIQPGVIDFRIGGFNLTDVLHGEPAHLIRAYNVLRQYDESAVPAALVTMGQALAPGGLLIEGTSTPTGRLVVFDVYQRGTDGDLRHRELVFGTNFRQAVDPAAFQAILPKRLIHHAQDAAPGAFFAAWRASLARARGAGLTGARRQWGYAVDALRERYGYPVDGRGRIVRRGYLVLRSRLDG